MPLLILGERGSLSSQHSHQNTAVPVVVGARANQFLKGLSHSRAHSRMCCRTFLGCQGSHQDSPSSLQGLLLHAYQQDFKRQRMHEPAQRPAQQPVQQPAQVQYPQLSLPPEVFDRLEYAEKQQIKQIRRNLQSGITQAQADPLLHRFAKLREQAEFRLRHQGNKAQRQDVPQPTVNAARLDMSAAHGFGPQYAQQPPQYTHYAPPAAQQYAPPAAQQYGWTAPQYAQQAVEPEYRAAQSGPQPPSQYYDQVSQARPVLGAAVVQDQAPVLSAAEGLELPGTPAMFISAAAQSQDWTAALTMMFATYTEKPGERRRKPRRLRCLIDTGSTHSFMSTHYKSCVKNKHGSGSVLMADKSVAHAHLVRPEYSLEIATLTRMLVSCS